MSREHEAEVQWAGGAGQGTWGGSVPVTLRARPPQRSGTIHGLKLPARVAARVQGSQIALGGPGAGGAQERERERERGRPQRQGVGPARSRLWGSGARCQRRGPLGLGAHTPWSGSRAPGWGGPTGQDRATARAPISEGGWPSAPLALSFAAHLARQGRPCQSASSFSWAPNHPVPFSVSPLRPEGTLAGSARG